jgi:hypothetical protein
MFLAVNTYKEGAGFTNLEYGLMAEYLGRSKTASEVSRMALVDSTMINLILMAIRLQITRRLTLATWKS